MSTIRLTRVQARQYADGLMRQVDAADAVGVRDADTEAARSRLAGIRSALAGGSRLITINNGIVARDISGDEPAPALAEAPKPTPVPLRSLAAPDPEPTTPPKAAPVPKGVVFRDPPAPKFGPPRRALVWPAKFNALRSRPGQWALVHTGHPTQASNITRGELAGAQRGEFEATTRKREDGKHDVYARYVGA